MVDFRRSRARDVGIVLVLALLVVDGVLVVMALRNRPDPPEVTVVGAPPPPTPTATATPTSTPTSTPTPTPTPTEEPAEPATARELPLSVLDAQTAVRGTPGTCADGGGAVEVTDDGGVNWSALEIPDVSVLRVRITDGSLWFIGAGGDCTEGYYERSVDDEGWEPSATTGTAWHLLADPRLPDVHAPDNFRRAPCEDSGASILELESAVGAPARLLCSDGTVHVTADNAATWTELGQVPGARAMGVADGEPLVAVADVEGCGGLALQQVTDPEPTDVGCVEDAADGDVALAFADDGRTGFLLAGGATWTTEDGGATWAPAA